MFSYWVLMLQDFYLHSRAVGFKNNFSTGMIIYFSNNNIYLFFNVRIVELCCSTIVECVVGCHAWICCFLCQASVWMSPKNIECEVHQVLLDLKCLLSYRNSKVTSKKVEASGPWVMWVKNIALGSLFAHQDLAFSWLWGITKTHSVIAWSS